MRLVVTTYLDGAWHHLSPNSEKRGILDRSSAEFWT
jgi:hypothetical protein